MTEPFAQTLHGWQNFYTLLGEASATLTGLMFVAASLGTRLINDDNDPKARTFITPPVLYFSLALLLSALMNVPTQTLALLTIQFAVVGLEPCFTAVRRTVAARRGVWPAAVSWHRAGRGGGRDGGAYHGGHPQCLEHNTLPRPRYSLLERCFDRTMPAPFRLICQWENHVR